MPQKCVLIMTCQRSEIRHRPEPAANRSRFRKPLHAFTLIELLVVIAIISLLASILLPSLKRSKELARRVVCSSNMRGMGLAFTMYISDWQGWFPPTRENGGADFPGPIRGVWAEKLYNDYSKNVNVFHCPSAADRIFTPNKDNGACGMAYGMEWWLGGGKYIGDVGHKITNIAQASATVLLGESAGKNPGDEFYHHGYAVHNCESTPWGLPDDTRHAGVSNILCVDGHVSSFTTDEALYDGELVWIRTP